MAVEPADCPRIPPEEMTGLASLINSNSLVFWYTVDPTCLRRSGNSERRTAARASASGRRHLFESLCSVSSRKRELPSHSSGEMRSKGIEQGELGVLRP